MAPFVHRRVSPTDNQSHSEPTSGSSLRRQLAAFLAETLQDFMRTFTTSLPSARTRGGMTPSFVAAANATRVSRTALLLTLVGLSAACDGRVVGWPADDDTAPMVTETTPGADAVGVPENAAISATFTEAMDPATLSGSTFLLSDGTRSIQGQVSFVGVTAIFVPAERLMDSTAYTATLTDGAADVAGNPLEEPYVWSFTTGVLPDTTAPMVSFTTPDNDATDVAPNTRITATFTEALDPLTVTDASFRVLDGDAVVVGEVTWSGRTAVFAPSETLELSTTYVAELSVALEDLSGNPLESPFVWSFSTGDTVDEIGPAVSSTTPAEGEVGVSTDSALVVTFTESMDPLTITTFTLTLLTGTEPVEGTVNLLGSTATFVPTDALLDNTVYVATVEQSVRDLAGNDLTTDYVWSFTTAADVDDVAPQVTFATPVPDSTDAMVNTVVTATFTEVMTASGFGTTTFTVLEGTTPVAGSVTYVGSTATFTPASDLRELTEFTARIESDVTDLAGNPMVEDFVWSFSTADSPDIIAPEVTSTTPRNGSVEVVSNTAVSVRFTEEMRADTLTTTSFTVRDGESTVAGTVEYTGVTAVFTPLAPLDDQTTYTATVATVATDLAGNALEAPYIWSFTVGTTPDTSAPRVIATVPLDAEGDVEINVAVNATFSETMDPTTLSAATYTLMQGLTPVPGIVTSFDTGVTFIPLVDLLPNRAYTATIGAGAADLAGNTLGTPYTWNFTTGDAPDITAPRLSSASPADGARNVTLGGDIVVFFTEPLNPATVTTLHFVVQQLDTRVPGTVEASGVSATFHADDALDPNTTYSVIVTNGMQDLAGNALLDSTVWSFRTGNISDSIRPFVQSTQPGSNATNVHRDSVVTATFNEVMNPASMNVVSFSLRAGATEVPATVTLIDSTVVLQPRLNLASATEYTATLTTSAADPARNNMESTTIWTFTTGALLDETAPTVVRAFPVSEATDVALDTAVSATFGEAMDPATINSLNIRLFGPGFIEVPATVRYSTTDRIATLVPIAPLLPETRYRFVVTEDATDMGGEAMAANTDWFFETGDSITDLTPVTLGSLASFVVLAGDGLNNLNATGLTLLNGNIALSPSTSCISDGVVCSTSNLLVNGARYLNDGVGIATQARIDLSSAQTDATARPSLETVEELGGRTLTPGVYASDFTMTIASGGTLTLDAQGNPDAVWIFRVGSSLTVGNNVTVELVNGANAANVFWTVFASSSIGSNTTFAGTVLSGDANSIGADSTLLGRLLGGAGAITLRANTITLPSP